MSTNVILQPGVDKPKRKNNGMRFVQLALLVGIIAAIYFSFNGNVLSTTPGVPALIGEFSLSHVEVGDNALEEIRAMYGEDITYAKAYVVHYKGNSGGLTLRIGEKREVADAESAITNVVSGTEKGQKKDFSDVKRVNVGGTAVYSLKVKGMPYHLYQSGNRVMWVDIMEGDPNEVLADVIRNYK